jgi:hypothetical protein
MELILEKIWKSVIKKIVGKNLEKANVKNSQIGKPLI